MSTNLSEEQLFRLKSQIDVSMQLIGGAFVNLSDYFVLHNVLL